MEIVDIVVDFHYFMGMIIAFSLFNLPTIRKLFLLGHDVSFVKPWGRQLDHKIVEILAYLLISTTFHAFDVPMHCL